MASEALFRAQRRIVQVEHSQGERLLRRPSLEHMRVQPGGSRPVTTFAAHSFYIKLAELQLRGNSERVAGQHFGEAAGFSIPRSRPMRCETALSRLCSALKWASLVTQVLYSFCNTRVRDRGCTLP